MNNNNSNEKRVLESLKNPNNCVNFNESSFVLNKLSHMNDDECHNDGKLGQNNNINDYMLSNYSSCNCKLSNVLDLSTQNQGVIIKDGYGISECKIDNDSEVRIGSVERHYKSDLQLFPRPYLTTPNIFKGEIKPNLESKLLSSIQSVKHKQMQNVDEQNIFTPLNKKLKSEIQDPKTPKPHEPNREREEQTRHNMHVYIYRVATRIFARPYLAGVFWARAKLTRMPGGRRMRDREK